MNDIVERLRAWVVNDSAELSDDDLIEAADEIVRLRADRSLARQVIEDYTEACSLALDIIFDERLRRAHDD